MKNDIFPERRRWILRLLSKIAHISLPLHLDYRAPWYCAHLPKQQTAFLYWNTHTLKRKINATSNICRVLVPSIHFASIREEISHLLCTLLSFVLHIQFDPVYRFTPPQATMLQMGLNFHVFFSSITHMAGEHVKKIRSRWLQASFVQPTFLHLTTCEHSRPIPSSLSALLLIYPRIPIPAGRAASFHVHTYSKSAPSILPSIT